MKKLFKFLFGKKEEVKYCKCKIKEGSEMSNRKKCNCGSKKPNIDPMPQKSCGCGCNH